MRSNLGGLIKELRNINRLSQSELADGICTQALISRIEKGDIIPSIDIFNKIIKKLNVSMEYISKKMAFENYDYFEELYSEIKFLLRKRDYLGVYNLIQIEKKNPNISFKEHRQFLLWQEAITLYHLHRSFSESLDLLNDALNLIEFKEGNIERRTEIINSIGIIHFEEKKYEEAIFYFDKAAKLLKDLPYIHDKTILIKILYNKAKALTRLSFFEDSIALTNLGIKNCLKNESNFLLGELYYHKGYNLSMLNKLEESNEELKKSLSMFEILSKVDFIEQVNRIINANYSKLNGPKVKLTVEESK